MSTSRKVVITGASGGIGSAVARRFAKEGDRLFLIGYRNREALEFLSVALDPTGSGIVSICLEDLSEERGVYRVADEIQDFFGAPDILVNCAGIAKEVLFQDSSEASYQKILGTNLSSYVRLTKALLPGMIARQSGRILNVSSVWGQAGASMEVEYSLTKGAVDAFTRALAKEVAPSGIAVNAVSPGLIDTKMNAGFSKEEMAALCERIPAGRAGKPEEVAEVLYLLSVAPVYLTGQVIRIDGGWV